MASSHPKRSLCQFQKTVIYQVHVSRQWWHLVFCPRVLLCLSFIDNVILKNRNYASGIRVLDCTLQKNPAPQQNLGGCHLQLHFVLHEIINRSIMLLIDFCWLCFSLSKHWNVKVCTSSSLTIVTLRDKEPQILNVGQKRSVGGNGLSPVKPLPPGIPVY